MLMQTELTLLLLVFQQLPLLVADQAGETVQMVTVAVVAVAVVGKLVPQIKLAAPAHMVRVMLAVVMAVVMLTDPLAEAAVLAQLGCLLVEDHLKLVEGVVQD